MVPSSRRAKTSSETQRRKNRAARKGKWPPRGTGMTVLTLPGMRPGEQARLVKTVKIQVKWAAAHFRQDRRLPSVVTRSRLWRATSVRSWVGIVFKTKTAPGSLSTGSPTGRTRPHGDGLMYSQANVRAGKCAAAPDPSAAVRDRGH